MPPEAETPREWIELAQSALVVARAARLPGALPSTGCFLAQQAAEKGLKAVLLSQRISFRRTHDLGELLERLPPDLDVPVAVQKAAVLTRFAVGTRYPGTHERPTWDDYERAFGLAEAVVKWAEGVIGSGGAA